MKISLIACVIFVCFLGACATVKEQIRNEEDRLNELPNKPIARTFYLLGDAGLSPNHSASSGLLAFQKHIENKDTKNDLVLFLGDNIYPAGMPEEGAKTRAAAEYNLDSQIESVQNFAGRAIFIPGNHDWYTDGLNGLKREQDYVENALGDDTFLPRNGCPLESIDLGETMQLIIIDSEWYLEDWNKHPSINDDCEIKTRERFLAEIEGELKKNEQKTIIFAMHHPMYTNGIHGGQYRLSKHLKPSEKLIPLPILGSLATQIRTQGGISIQDRYNERYNELMKRLETLVADSDQTVFVSGHEHSLQYIVQDGIKQIVSGAGAKSTFATLNNNGLFSYGKQGFANLIVYQDGSAWVQFFAAATGSPVLLFQKEVFPAKIPYDLSSLPTQFSPTVKAAVYSTEETEKTDFFRSVWGDHYRKAYSTAVEVPVLVLDTLKGGVTVMRKGGGHQTRSLRLQTTDGKELNMRALRKSATQFLQTVLYKETYIEEAFKKTAVEALVLDFYTAAHPYAFLAIPDLSAAANLYHTNPKLYYVPKQKALGDYNTHYGGELYMIEERPEDNYSDEREFGFADDIESTYDIIEKIRKDEKYKIDEETYIRARLFDMLIGDWDRHQDQWRWAQFDQPNGDKLYKPIPRDRDQVFSNFDGALLDVMKLFTGAAKQFQVYDSTLSDIKWMNMAGVKLDRVLIQESDRDVWIKQARYLQDQITAEVIAKAFAKIPQAVQDQTLEEIKEHLKGRRNNLVDIAERYANYLDELAVVTATDKDDFIRIDRSGKGETTIKISRIKDGEKGEVLIDRTFNADTTKEIWVYALDDKDSIEVTGKAKKNSLVRIVGGQNNDTYRITNGKKVRIYDHKSKKNTLAQKGGASVFFTDDYDLNLFDYTRTISRTNLKSPILGYNPDDGMLVGFSYTHTYTGFARNPFSQQHKFSGGYYFATQGFDLEYQGEFNVKSRWNLSVGLKFTSENYTNNFFGFGNETPNNDDQLGLDYNRISKGVYGLSIGMIKRSPFGSDFNIKLNLDAISIAPNDDTIITDLFPTATAALFDRRYFGTLSGGYTYTSQDKAIAPTRGMNFAVGTGLTADFDAVSNSFIHANGALGFYNTLSQNRKLILKTQVTTQLIFGDEVPFYYAANLGDKTGLRGYRTQRFTGQKSVVGNVDVQYNFGRFTTSVAPMQLGIFVGYDLGRVWIKEEDSQLWHSDFGGGFWVAAAEMVSGKFNFFTSREGLRFSFGLGINF